MEQQPLKPEEELIDAINRFDIPGIRSIIEYEASHSLVNKVLKFINPVGRGIKEKTLEQLGFLEKVISQLDKEKADEKAYIVLGALEFIQQCWGKFPNSGPMLELLLKQDDLVQCIAENAEGINLKDMFSNPNLIVEKAELSFLKFANNQPVIHKALKEIQELT